MPRKARIVLPRYPHHVVQRGHNGKAIFVHDNDRLYYLSNLIEWKDKLGCRIYAYCLMPNHVHLIVDPGDSTTSLGLLMKRVSGRQTRYFNKIEDRRGTLWEGRYHSSPIDVDAYLMACSRYVELNPVRAGIVKRPGEYRWSSYQHKAGYLTRDWISEDPVYLSLGETLDARRKCYRHSMERALSAHAEHVIRTAAARGQLTGNSDFAEEVYRRTGRRIVSRGRGRPKGSPPIERNEAGQLS